MREITVYADVLFLINFSMDFLTLFFTGKVLSKSVKTARLCVAASFGAIAGTLATVFSERSGLWSTVGLTVAGFAVSLIMTCIAFGKYNVFRVLLRDGVILWGSGALLGGVMTYLLSLGDPVFTGTDGTVEFAAAFAVCFFVSIVVVRLFSSGRQKKCVNVRVEAADVTAETTALVDSGNLAREPISSLPVVILSSQRIKELAKMTDENDTRLAIRLIPIKTLGGEKIMKGFIPGKITVDGKEVGAVVAVDKENRTFGGYGGIVPSGLCEKIMIKRGIKEE